MQESQNSGIRVVTGIAGYREQNVSHIEELHRLREMSYQRRHLPAGAHSRRRKMKDYKKSKSDFVYDVLNDEFNTEEIVRGMMYWYFIKGRTINNLHDDMLYHSHGFYKADDIKEVLLVVKRACEDFIA